MIRTALLFALVLLPTQLRAQAPAALPVVWKLSEGLSSPESAYFDAGSGFLYLSQIGQGGGDGKDGDGWISKISPDGKAAINKWVSGLNAPKGLRSHGNSLWVSDIDRIVEIDIAAGKIARAVNIPQAKFLNDLACSPDGTVYVADMAASRIYQYRDDEVSIFAEGEELEHPNGLLVHEGALIIGAWGKNFQPDFSTDPKGRLLRLDLATKELTPITPNPTGNLDGVEADSRGGFIVTDWVAGTLFHIKADGTTTVLASFPKGAADHAFLVEKNLLILPQMMENTLTAFDLSEVLK